MPDNARFMLDTNTLSYFIRGLHAPLVERVRQGLLAQSVVISAITHAEIRFGQHRMDAADKRRPRIDEVLADIHTLPWDQRAAQQYGLLKSRLYAGGRPIGELDTQIAAHALAKGLVLVTHNTRHFVGIDGLALQDWLQD